ncbi:N-acetylmuramoyl-L-alanine amidase [Xanthomonas maliensis]|uniref:N-acetylmuramoyl-L-alanine amidase n=1 Tax=Xanthomonas maliensis TaxID=1321368 RepID=UPI0004CE14B0|nr:N-acetylmuramoyl-L-alanine amidase [Xanthomonas maliensis]KAB7768085.1 N-acetylmuramoyl-L-alanine amidase [Xanthomonas maliensis]
MPLDPLLWHRRWPRAALCLALLALVACTHAPPRNPLATWVPSDNHDLRRPILIVLHFTDQQSVEQSLRTLRGRNSGGPVSAHYLIGKDGRRYQLVSDQARAWHAGAGRWGSITDVNSASIGIELDNDGHTPFADAQIDSLLVLLDDLCRRLRIPRSQIVGHEDVAPTRKNDPGPLFPWNRLAEAGFGRWPSADAPPPPADFDPWQALALLGYSLDDPAATLRAFHHHFRGSDAPTLDAEDLRILHALTAPLRLPPSTDGPTKEGEGA